MFILWNKTYLRNFPAEMNPGGYRKQNMKHFSPLLDHESSEVTTGATKYDTPKVLESESQEVNQRTSTIEPPKVVILNSLV